MKNWKEFLFGFCAGLILLVTYAQYNDKSIVNDFYLKSDELVFQSSKDVIVSTGLIKNPQIDFEACTIDDGTASGQVFYCNKSNYLSVVYSDDDCSAVASYYKNNGFISWSQTRYKCDSGASFGFAIGTLGRYPIQG